MKNKGGRPFLITETVLAKLREGFLMGFDDEEACAYVDINPSTLYRYQEAHPEYASKKEAWKKNPILEAKATVTKRLKYDAELAFKYLERKKKSEFASRHELTGEGGDPLKYTLEIKDSTS